MGSWHTAVSPCHCDNPLHWGLLYFKKKNFNHPLIKRVVTTAIQKSSKNILQLPPLPKITTTAHSTTAILTHSQFILPQIPQNSVPTKTILLENPANHSPQAVILVSQAISSVSSANPVPPFKLPAPLSKSWPTKMRRRSFVCYVWFGKRKKKKIKEIDLGKGLFAGHIRKRCF
jgi:hypothetical protein